MDGRGRIETEDMCQSELGTSPTTVQAGQAADVETLHERLAWPVAERMLQILASENGRREFRAEEFVKEAFEATFPEEVTSGTTEAKEQSGEGTGSQGCSVVDAALGALGYGATTICERKINILVEILSSLVQAKVSCGFHSLCSTYPQGACDGERTSQGDETINARFCEQRICTTVFLQMVESCTPFLVNGKAYGTQVLEVVDALLRVAVNTSLFMPHSEAFSPLYRKMVCDNENSGRNRPARALQSFIDYVLDNKDFTQFRLHPANRLRFWRLRPLCLKQDLSCLAREAMNRLLLPLDKELYRREEWATLAVCLAWAPDVFMEARRILHTWFLHSGTLRLWELRAQLVSAVLNVVKSPAAAWGITAGASFPPQHAFYHTSLRPFIVLLSSAPTLRGLVKLVGLLDHMENFNRSSAGSSSACPARSHAKKEEDTSFNSRHMNHNSLWALLMDFLPWLHFAFRVLFQRQSSQQKSSAKCTDPASADATREGPEDASFSINETDGKTFPWVAAKYIAWILNPTDLNLRASNEQMLLECSNSWDDVVDAVHIDKNPVVRLEGDPQSLQGDGEAVSLNCTRCGVSACRVKRQKCDETDGACRMQCHETSVCWERFSLAALDLWLTELQRKLGAVDHGLRLEEVQLWEIDGKIKDKGTCSSSETRAPFSTLSHSDHKQQSFMMKSLLRGALAEILPKCSLHIMSHLLQFVGSGGMLVLSDGKKCQDTGTQATKDSSHYSTIHCDQGILQIDVSVVNPRGTKCQAGDWTGNRSAREQQRSANWIAGSAALFNFLDSIDEFVWQGVVCESERKTASKMYQNLAVTMSKLVDEWASTFETQLETGILLNSLSKEHHVIILEDLHQRFCAWVGKLQLSTEVQKVCDNARKSLDVRIANLQRLLNSP